MTAEDAMTLNEEFAALLRPFLRYINDGELSPESELYGLGLDSMRAVELLFAIEDAYQIELPEEKLTDETFRTAGALWVAIREVRAIGGEDAA
jgi:acyl carrier protein